jgi:hypothetical protein
MEERPGSKVLVAAKIVRTLALRVCPSNDLGKNGKLCWRDRGRRWELTKGGISIAKRQPQSLYGLNSAPQE